jgi:hypothetical protein
MGAEGGRDGRIAIETPLAVRIVEIPKNLKNSSEPLPGFRNPKLEPFSGC